MTLSKSGWSANITHDKLDGVGEKPLGSDSSTDSMKRFHLHCVSDSTGDTIRSVARACLVQFDGAGPVEHLWPLARTPRAIERVLEYIAADPGPVLFTIVNEKLRDQLMKGCRRLQVPCISVLDPVIAALGAFLGRQPGHKPGKQHVLDAEYFKRIEAMDWAIAHDDGQQFADIETADVVLIGVSRTSKTPTSLYLANRGIKAANVPFIPGIPLPKEIEQVTRPLVVGLTKDAKHLVEIRRSRLLSLQETHSTSYTDPERVKEEIASARRLFTQHGWSVIDVTRRSIEETAAAVTQLLVKRKAAAGAAAEERANAAE